MLAAVRTRTGGSQARTVSGAGNGLFDALSSGLRVVGDLDRPVSKSGLERRMIDAQLPPWLGCSSLCGRSQTFLKFVGVG